MKFVVTHYARQSPDEDRWVILPFVSRRVGEIDGPYFFGFDIVQEFTAESIIEQEKIGSIRRISRPYLLPSDQALWLTPESEICIASRTSPQVGQRLLIATDISPHEVPDADAVDRCNWVQKKIASRKPTPFLVIADDEYLLKSTFRNSLMYCFLEKLKVLSGAFERATFSVGAIPASELVDSIEDDGPIDFYRDLFFQTRMRSKHADIVQIGSLNTFKCVLNDRGEELPKGLLSDDQTPFSEQLVNFLQQSPPDAEIGIITDTAAAKETSDVLGPYISFIRRVRRTQDIYYLWTWLHESPNSRIAIVDHGIATQLEDLNYDKVELHVPVPPRIEKSQENARFSSGNRIFRFRHPIPTGFMFPRSCSAWGVTIRSALAEAIVELGEYLPWDRTDGGPNSIEAELSTIGVKVFPFRELCKQIGLTEHYHSRVVNGLVQALNNDDDSRAKRLQKELAQIETEFLK